MTPAGLTVHGLHFYPRGWENSFPICGQLGKLLRTNERVLQVQELVQSLLPLVSLYAPAAPFLVCGTPVWEISQRVMTLYNSGHSWGRVLGTMKSVAQLALTYRFGLKAGLFCSVAIETAQEVFGLDGSKEVKECMFMIGLSRIVGYGLALLVPKSDAIAVSAWADVPFCVVKFGCYLYKMYPWLNNETAAKDLIVDFLKNWLEIMKSQLGLPCFETAARVTTIGAKGLLILVRFYQARSFSQVLKIS